MAEALLQLEDGGPGWVQALGWCCPLLDCHVSSEGWGRVPADRTRVTLVL